MARVDDRAAWNKKQFHLFFLSAQFRTHRIGQLSVCWSLLSHHFVQIFFSSWSGNSTSVIDCIPPSWTTGSFDFLWGCVLVCVCACVYLNNVSAMRGAKPIVSSCCSEIKRTLTLWIIYVYVKFTWTNMVSAVCLHNLGEYSMVLRRNVRTLFGLV